MRLDFGGSCHQSNKPKVKLDAGALGQLNKVVGVTGLPRRGKVLHETAWGCFGEGDRGAAHLWCHLSPTNGCTNEQSTATPTVAPTSSPTEWAPTTVADAVTNDVRRVCILMALGGALRILSVIPREGGTKILGAPIGITAVRCTARESPSNDRADKVAIGRNGSSDDRQQLQRLRRQPTG